MAWFFRSYTILYSCAGPCNISTCFLDCWGRLSDFLFHSLGNRDCWFNYCRNFIKKRLNGTKQKEKHNCYYCRAFFVHGLNRWLALWIFYTFAICRFRKHGVYRLDDIRSAKRKMGLDFWISRGSFQSIYRYSSQSRYVERDWLDCGSIYDCFYFCVKVRTQAESELKFWATRQLRWHEKSLYCQTILNMIVS